MYCMHACRVHCMYCMYYMYCLQTKAPETLKSLEAKGASAFSLAKHVIPLSQLKSRQDAFDVGMQVSSDAADFVHTE
jgi:hypothetical protein